MINYKNTFFVMTLVIGSIMYGGILNKIRKHEKDSLSSCLEQQSNISNEIEQLLVELNHDFANYEKNNPQQGYCVTIQTSPNLQATLTPYGGKRTTALLSGILIDQPQADQMCLFCNSLQTNKNSFIFQDFGDGTCAIKSLNHQILIIPDKHFTHLFDAPLSMQAIILHNILKVRQQYADKIQRPIEFHCGSAAGQTVFHLHGRTGVYIK